MESTVYSLIPPIVALAMVLITRRVLLSLGIGSVTAAILLADFQIGETVAIILDSIKGLFISDGEINSWNVNIILFLLLLGCITAFVSISGGSRAFGEWALKRVKTRTGAQLTAACLGIIIFIDDYFNSLAVGQIARPLTDRNGVSRAKLAYIIDSTAAPICVISPISSWGAYIIALLVPILSANSMGISGFSAFVQMIPMNFYVLAALLFVFISSWKNINFGKMKIHEDRAQVDGIVASPDKQAPGELSSNLPISEKGSIYDLIIPIITLIIGTVSAMLWTGSRATEGRVTILKMFENTDVALSLVIGGSIGFIVTIVLFLRQVYSKRAVDRSLFVSGLVEGVRSMMPAVLILLFAWVLCDLIGALETGSYLAGIVHQLNISIGFLPFIFFVLAGIMALSTGTSWGSFGILLPIAGDIVATIDSNMLLPSLAAVLAGAVFGDHCSPISDTTILSSTGAGCNHIDHVLTQLPYALTAALIAAVGFLMLGLTGSTILSFILVIALCVIILYGLNKLSARNI